MKQDDIYGPFFDSVLETSRSLSITIESGHKATIDSSKDNDDPYRYWVIIYTDSDPKQEYVRYLVNISSIELHISNNGNEELNLLLTHWKETKPGVIVQCDLTSES